MTVARGDRGTAPAPTATAGRRGAPDFEHDAIFGRAAQAGLRACPRCEVVLFEGRWRWMLPPTGSSSVLCPACRRMDDDYPAGIVTLSGPILVQRRTEILHLIHNEEMAERDEHRLSRLMGMSTGDNSVELSTTHTRLGQRIGEAVYRTFGGHLNVRYSDDDSQVRVRWER
jgi:hypothetical protein